MSDDDWDAPITLNKPVPLFDDEDEAVDLDVSGTTESTKPKKAVDEKQALSKAKSASKQKQKERDEELAREAERARSARPMTAEERVAEQLRLKRLVEEADAQLAGDLFGGAPGGKPGVNAAKAADGVQDVDTLKAVLQRVSLNTNKETDDLAKAVGQRLELGVTRAMTVAFLKNLLRNTCQTLTDEDVLEITGVLNVIKNEKVKAKLAKKKPATTAKPKGNLGLGGDTKFDLDGTVSQSRGVGHVGGAFDDDDFM
jgi:translation initiation factor 3 subunit J